MLDFISETGSTNADLSTRLAAGERIPEGYWLVADRQNQGRGRLGRAWFDAIGNFMGSTVVDCRPGDPSLGTLALLAGLAVHEAVAPLIPVPHRPQLKWPNDVLIDRAKLCGILLERVGNAVVVGIGVNLAVAPVVEGRETIALSALGETPDRNRFADALAQSFATELERWRSYGLEPLIARWLTAAHPEGTPLSVGEPGEDLLAGTFAGLSPDGALQLRLADGQMRTIHAGEVRLADQG